MKKIFEKKRVFGMVKSYKWLLLALLGASIGLVLQLVGLYLPSHILLSVVASIFAALLAWQSINNIRNGNYGLEILPIVAVVSAIVAREYWVALLITIFYCLGKIVEVQSVKTLKNKAINELRSDEQVMVTKLAGRDNQVVSSKDINIGDKLVVGPGEVFSVDCVIFGGQGQIDKSISPCANQLSMVDIGDTVLSGSRNNSNVSFSVRALAMAKDSRQDQVISWIRNANVQQTSFVRLVNAYSTPFALLAVIVAGAAWYVSKDFNRFVQVIVVASPCSFLVAAPIALSGGIAKLARFGVVVKNVSSLEKLALARAIAFGKTGTLTNGIVTIKSLHVTGKLPQGEVLALAGSLAAQSDHHVCRAIKTYVLDTGIKLSKSKNASQQLGRGIVGIVGKHSVVVGSMIMLKEHNIEIPQTDGPNVFIAVDGSCVGYFELKDNLRDDAHQAITDLQANGLKRVMMLTGDSRNIASIVAKKLGIKEFTADCLPGDKITTLENIKAKPIVFVGCDTNDVVSFTVADVGLVMGWQAKDTADIFVLNDDIRSVTRTYIISKHSFRIANRSILASVVVSLLLMAMFATGRFAAIYGALVIGLANLFAIILLTWLSSNKRHQ